MEAISQTVFIRINLSEIKNHCECVELIITGSKKMGVVFFLMIKMRKSVEILTVPSVTLQ